MRVLCYHGIFLAVISTRLLISCRSQQPSGQRVILFVLAH